MSDAGHHRQRTFTDKIEETLIAIILGLMTIITFVNVIARYGFNENILWALEVTSILFAWLILLGVSYCVKITAHLGVDAVINLVSAPVRKTLTLIAVVLCILYALLLLKGGWDSGQILPTCQAPRAVGFLWGLKKNFWQRAGMRPTMSSCRKCSNFLPCGLMTVSPTKRFRGLYLMSCSRLVWHCCFSASCKPVGRSGLAKRP